MHGSTFLLALTKTDRAISLDLREKRKIPFPLSIPLSSLFPRSPFAVFVPKMAFSPLFNFSHFLFFSFPYFLFFFYFLVLSFSLFSPLDTWLNVSHSHKCTTCHAMCHPTLNASKNVKFRLSWNLMKFDEVTRFCETNSTVKSVSPSEI